MTHTIDPEFKVKWIEALKSGKYKKGKRVLRTITNRYCCLGVAGDLLCPDEWELATSEQYYRLRNDVAGLSESIRNMIGLVNFDQGKLMSLNDNNKTFDPAIKWIEENL